MAIRFGDNGAFTWLSGSDEGNLSIVGAITSSVVVEHSYEVSGAISTAAGVSASLGVSGAYGHFNTLGINDGGTNNIALGAGVLISTGYFEISEMTAPGNPDSNKGRLYVADDSGTTKLFFKDSAGTATNLLAGGSGAVSAVANGADNRVATFSSGDALNGEANLTFDGSKLAVAGEISGSGVLNVVGLATLEGALNVTGAITTAAGLTASAGVSSSYGFVNNLGVNQGGTKSIQLLGSGLLAIIGGAAGTTCLSASGDVNVVGNSFIEGTLNVTGAISTAAGVTASSGVSASYGNFNSVGINDGGTNSVIITGDGIVNATQRVTSALGITGSSMLVNGKIHLNANANIGGVSSLSASLGITGSSVRVNDTIHLNANGNITSVHHIYPAADNTYDLGAAGNRWRNIYTGDLHLSNESRGGGNEIDGTWGSYTIQEGENDLFLINKRTGKKLRFVTEEV